MYPIQKKNKNIVTIGAKTFYRRNIPELEDFMAKFDFEKGCSNAAKKAWKEGLKVVQKRMERAIREERARTRMFRRLRFCNIL